MDLKAIDLEQFKDEKDGWYEIDLFPDRSFERVVDVILYQSESFGSFHYHYLFEYYNARNVRVRVHSTYNLFPIASLIGHTVILQSPRDENSIYKNLCGQRSTYEFDRSYAKGKYNIDKWEVGKNATKCTRWLNNVDIWPKDSPLFFRAPQVMTGQWELRHLFDRFINRTVLIDKKGLDIFNNEIEKFPKDCIWMEYSRVVRRQTNLADIAKLIGDNSDIPTHIMQKEKYGGNGFLEEMISEYEGNKYYLTYQILCSLINNVKFVGLGGAGSLFSITPHINCVIMSECGGCSSQSSTGFFKSMFNKTIFDQDTYCFPYEDKTDFAHSYHLTDKNRLEFIKTVAKSLTNEKMNINFNLIKD